MERVKICVVVTARPSYARVRSLLLALQTQPGVELQIVVCASALLSRYGSVVDVLEADGLPVTERVYSVVEGETLETTARSTGLLLLDLAATFRRLEPDLVVVNADRHEVLAAAQAARYQEIPLAHLQGGEQTGSIDDRVRDAITQLADYHMVSTARAATRVLTMRAAEPGGGVYLTGCPSIDACVDIGRDPDVTAWELGGAGAGIDLSDPFICLLLHPTTEGHARAYDQTSAALRACEGLDMGIVAFWPGNEAGMDGASKALREYQDRIHTVRNLPPRRFLKLLTQSACLVGNSSVGIRECSYLGVPVVNVGTRQQGRERGPNVVDVPEYGVLTLRNAIERQVRAGFYPRSELYGDGQAGARMAEVLAHVTSDRCDSRAVGL